MEGSVNEELLTKVRTTTRGADDEVKHKDRIWIETKKRWIVDGPAKFSRISTSEVTVITLAFIGHIGPTELAAYALVSTVLLKFANGILLGTTSALETLCGQSYGAKRYDMLGVYLKRSWLLLFLCSVALLPVFIFTTPILIALGQDESIAKVAGIISLWLILVVFSYVVSYTCQMFLQVQSKNMIIAYLASLSLTIHVFLSWLLTLKYKFGLSGAMISTILDSEYRSSTVSFWWMVPRYVERIFDIGLQGSLAYYQAVFVIWYYGLPRTVVHHDTNTFDRKHEECRGCH
ncbi:MatE family protein, expressed [Heracleum sosnowskyi]|uniref:MatE family protein, expressed n=1 Tax=Heracleum sosnowskyi TaxID=360622 RepID=A0AAD8N5F1_9APIA|nr:MatE family protein, expressed [Heracleum sosnowskyi]